MTKSPKYANISRYNRPLETGNYVANFQLLKQAAAIRIPRVEQSKTSLRRLPMKERFTTCRILTHVDEIRKAIVDDVITVTPDTAGVVYDFRVTAINSTPGGSNTLELSGRIAYCGFPRVKAKIWVRNDERATFGIDDHDLARLEQHEISMAHTAHAVNVNLKLPIEVLLRGCRDHFDRTLVAEVYRKRGYAHVADTFNRGDSLRQFIELNIKDPHDRAEFLVYYLEELKSKVAAKANCGCVYHAEQGIPCEHDLALLEQDANVATGR